MFRFTIRDVLWLTVVVGMGVGWWVDRANLVAFQIREAERRDDEALLAVDEVRKKMEAVPGLRGALKIRPEMDAAIEKARMRRK